MFDYDYKLWGWNITLFSYSEKVILKDPKNNRGETPFHLACQFGHFKMAEMLVPTLPSTCI